MIGPIQENNFRAYSNEVDPEVHKTREAQSLKESCQQFEAILWSKLWKDMRNSARAINGSDKNRPWGQMEDLSLEMASEDIVKSSGGAGMWKMLYDSMIGHIAAEQTSGKDDALRSAVRGLHTAGAGAGEMKNSYMPSAEYPSFDAQG